jgi:hypothetical protein
MVLKLSSEVEHVKNDHADLKLQTQDTHEAPAHVSVIQIQVISSTATHKVSTN